MLTIIIVITVGLGFYMAWMIGANDVANSMANAVGSKAISVRRAIIAAGICEFAGAVLVGAHVTQTVRGGIVPPEAITQAFGMDGVDMARGLAALAIGMSCALLAAALWLNIATWLSMPVSTTHSIVGAIAGIGIIGAGWAAVRWGMIARIVASWFISPVAGAIMAIIFFKIISWTVLSRDQPLAAARKTAPIIAFFTTFIVITAILYKGMEHILPQWMVGHGALLFALVLALIVAFITRLLIGRHLQDDGVPMEITSQLGRVEKLFAPMVIGTSCCVAFSHGANDVANAVGPLATVIHIVRHADVPAEVAVPLWILGIGGTGIVVGLATYGYRVMRTVGERITQLTPSRGVAADVAVTATVLGCSRLGMPVSTTHTLVGAILGIGLVRGLAAVNKRVTRNIFGSWLITVPVAAVLAIVLFLIGQVVLLERLTEYFTH